MSIDTTAVQVHILNAEWTATCEAADEGRAIVRLIGIDGVEIDIADAIAAWIDRFHVASWATPASPVIAVRVMAQVAADAAVRGLRLDENLIIATIIDPATQIAGDADDILDRVEAVLGDGAVASKVRAAHERERKAAK